MQQFVIYNDHARHCLFSNIASHVTWNNRAGKAPASCTLLAPGQKGTCPWHTNRRQTKGTRCLHTSSPTLQTPGQARHLPFAQCKHHYNLFVSPLCGLFKGLEHSRIGWTEKWAIHLLAPFIPTESIQKFLGLSTNEKPQEIAKGSSNTTTVPHIYLGIQDSMKYRGPWCGTFPHQLHWVYWGP